MSKLSLILKAALSRPWDRRVGVAFYCFFAGLALMFISLSREKIKSIEELREVTGQITSYAFSDGSRSHYYRLHLENYPSTFQIRADDISSFDIGGFNRNVHRGDRITLGISRQSYEHRLHDPGDVQLFSIRKNETQFLRPEGVIEGNNNPAPLLIGMLFSMVAVGLLLSRGLSSASSYPGASPSGTE